MGLCLMIVAETEIGGDERTVIYEHREFFAESAKVNE